jgi:hypothetical protein
VCLPQTLPGQEVGCEEMLGHLPSTRTIHHLNKRQDTGDPFDLVQRIERYGRRR